MDELSWIVPEQMTLLGWMTRFDRGATVTEEHVATKEAGRRGWGGDVGDGGSPREEEPSYDDDVALVDASKTIHTQPRCIRKSRRAQARCG